MKNFTKQYLISVLGIFLMILSCFFLGYLLGIKEGISIRYVITFVIFNIGIRIIKLEE